MRRIDLENDGGGGAGLLALVVAVMEILVDTMEREAIRRMQSGELAADEIERLGSQLQAIEAEINDLKQREQINDDVNRLRHDLDSIVSEAIVQVETESANHDNPLLEDVR